VVVAVASAMAEPVAMPVRTLPIGAPGPAFQDVRATDGRHWSLSDVAGAPAVVLIFTSNRCPTAKAHAARLETLRRAYEPRGVRILLINSNDPHLHPEERFERMVERAAADGDRLPYLWDADQSIARAYGPTCTFHAFVLDGSGRLAYEGRFDDARLEERVRSRDVEAALDAILGGRDVDVASTPAFGCALEIAGADETFPLPIAAGPFIAAPGVATGDSTAAASTGAQPAGLGAGLALASAGGWAITALSDVTGAGNLMNHDALIHGGPLGPPPIWLAILGFLVAWQVMLAAMMVPASTPAIRVVGQALATRARPVLESAGFVAAFAAVWSAFGLAAFAGDWVLHHIVDATPWLAARPELIQSGVLALAGGYQFTAWKRRGLAACRDPLGVAACCVPAGRRAGVRAGLRHALDCLGASWALMLLMFAVGPGALVWMVALAGIMTYEVRADDGAEAAGLFGVFLVGFAGARLLGVIPLG
jgi:predicted metal-binding membrane protein/peroxiredoxin